MPKSKDFQYKRKYILLTGYEYYENSILNNNI